MLALVKKPRIEISLQGENVGELIAAAAEWSEELTGEEVEADEGTPVDPRGGAHPSHHRRCAALRAQHQRRRPCAARAVPRR